MVWGSSTNKSSYTFIVGYFDCEEILFGELKQNKTIQKEGLPNIDSMITVDTTVNYIGFENTTLTLGATNLFNEEPPFSHHDYFGYVNSVHSAQGRFVYVKASYKF